MNRNAPKVEAVAAVRAIYAELAARPIERGCLARTECCHFKLTGKTPYLTKGEALVAAKAWRATGRTRLPAKPQTLLETLMFLLSLYGVHQPFPERCQFILEGDRLRVLRSAEALDAWETWWESRKK